MPAKGRVPDEYVDASETPTALEDAGRPGRTLTIHVGQDILDLPEPDWLLRDFIQEGGLTIIHGEPGSGKSLVMMDWANVLAAEGTGWKWAGRERTAQCKVLYVMGEGLGGLKGRILAWQQERALDYIPDVHYLLEPVDLRKKEDAHTPMQEWIIDYIADEGICAVFVDTLAATFGAGNENMQQDMNQYLATLWEFQRAGAAVVVSHHDAKASKDLRGSSVLKGAADTVVQMDPDFGELGLRSSKLKLRKQKDGMPFAPLVLKPKQYDVDTKHETSLVLKYDGVVDPSATMKEDLLSCISSMPQTWTQIRDSVNGTSKVLALHRDSLEGKGLIEQIEGLWYVVADKEEEAGIL